jgi:hypothetical protein
MYGEIKVKIKAKVRVKLKQSLYKPRTGSEGSRMIETVRFRHMNMVRLLALSTDQLSRRQGQSAVGRITSPLGNETQDLLAFGVVPQPTALPCEMDK